jgi:hypothetical protein
MDSYHGLCRWVLDNFGLHAVFFDADRSADLLAVRIVSSFLGLHLAEFATEEITTLVRKRNRLAATQSATPLGYLWGEGIRVA